MSESDRPMPIMTEEQAKAADRQHWRYTFAGQIAAAYWANGLRGLSEDSGTPAARLIVERADALLAELERTEDTKCA